MSSTQSQAPGPDSPGNPWDQLPGEPDRWYGRFKVYLDLGPTRTFKAACTKAGIQRRGKPYTISSSWADYARQWHWRARAEAWDVHQRELIALSERNRRSALRGRRIEIMEDYLEDVRSVLDSARMAEVDQHQARAWLPQMRHFLLELLVAERQEFERLDYEKGDPNNSLVITADDLRAAQRALEAQSQPPTLDAPGDSTTPLALSTWSSRISKLPLGASGASAAPLALSPLERYPAGRTLFVCIGPDRALMLDLAALRSVRAATGLQFNRLLDATRPRFAAMLRRQRGFGHPVELLHLAVHASPAGLQFADSTADGNWLSEHLLGVRVLLLACCEGDGIGDWLGVVPHVITLSEEISHEDAAVLAQHFWHNIGLNMEPGAALDEALTHCPPALRACKSINPRD